MGVFTHATPIYFNLLEWSFKCISNIGMTLQSFPFRLLKAKGLVQTVIWSIWFSVLPAASVPALQMDSDPREIVKLFEQQVDNRLQLPDSEHLVYAALLEESLIASDMDGRRAQFFLLVDRNPRVQSAMLFWRSPQGSLHLIGASPVSTGKPGKFEHFLTPVGVFPNTIANPDYRSEGTKNENGIRGYGIKGMRVYDFGWQVSQRGWGKGGMGPMRLQVHSTDPALLEARLGTIQSKGCIRIPATLNTFLDRFAILDSNYESALQRGESYWVLSPSRQPNPWAGTYLVVVDSLREDRPLWAKPLPPSKQPK